MAHVRLACAEFLEATSQFYKVSDCDVRVLAARPLRVRESWTSELFGDYSPDMMLIRVWARTAVRKEVTSFGTFLSTLCHEFCHHLDYHKFKFADSWHTRGFYELLLANLFTNGARNNGGSRQASLVFGDIQVRFVQRQWLNKVGVALEDLPNIMRDGAVACEIRRHEDRARTQAFRPHCRHG